MCSPAGLFCSRHPRVSLRSRGTALRLLISTRASISALRHQEGHGLPVQGHESLGLLLSTSALPLPPLYHASRVSIFFQRSVAVLHSVVRRSSGGGSYSMTSTCEPCWVLRWGRFKAINVADCSRVGIPSSGLRVFVLPLQVPLELVAQIYPYRSTPHC